VIDAYRCDLTNLADVRAVFEKYGKGRYLGCDPYSGASSTLRIVDVVKTSFLRRQTGLQSRQRVNLGKRLMYYHDNATATVYL